MPPGQRASPPGRNSRNAAQNLAQSEPARNDYNLSTKLHYHRSGSQEVTGDRWRSTSRRARQEVRARGGKRVFTPPGVASSPLVGSCGAVAYVLPAALAGRRGHATRPEASVRERRAMSRDRGGTGMDRLCRGGFDHGHGGVFWPRARIPLLRARGGAWMQKGADAGGAEQTGRSAAVAPGRRARLRRRCARPAFFWIRRGAPPILRTPTLARDRSAGPRAALREARSPRVVIVSAARRGATGAASLISA